MAKIICVSDDWLQKMEIEIIEESNWTTNVHATFSPELGFQDKESIHYIIANHILWIFAKGADETEITI